MKAIIKSILVLSLMIIFGPVTDSYAEALSSQEILEVCDDGLCDNKKLEVETEQGDLESGWGETREEAIEEALEVCKSNAREKAYKALVAQSSELITDGKLEYCDEGCETYGIHRPVIGAVEFTDIVQNKNGDTYLVDFERQSDESGNWFVFLYCKVKAEMEITRICVSESNQCIEQEKEFVQELLEQK